MLPVKVVSLFLFLYLFADLKEMCELLGIEQSVLERAFSYRTVEAKMEKVSTTLNVAQVSGKAGVVIYVAPAIRNLKSESLILGGKLSYITVFTGLLVK